MADPIIAIYNGPLSWYQAEMAGTSRKSLLAELIRHEEESRNSTITVRGGGHEDPPPPPKRRRLSHVEMLSSDYASLNEHVIQNFAAHIARMRPVKVSLHNPPQQVALEVVRRFKASVEEYEYPKLTDGMLRSLNRTYDARVIGQRRVKRQLLSVLHALMRADRTKPLVLMFYGPSGVGKTETAHVINAQLKGKLLRKQFSMFHSEKFASYLFGGGHSEASFAHDLLDRESGVVLIDEFDKANRYFFSAFFELFDEGVFEDKNYRVTVGPAIIICTSNYGSSNEIREAIGDALMSRFDAMIEFAPLSTDDMIFIANQLVDARHAELPEDEQALVNPQVAKDYVQRVIKSDGNVRRLKKQVEQVISRIIVDVKYPESDPQR